jgi:hypothetical protein
MPKLLTPKLPKQLAAALRQAEALAADERLVSAFHAAADNVDLQGLALVDPVKFLAGHGVTIPDTLHLQFVDVELPGRPYPFGTFFNIVLTKCRTYWVREKGTDGKLGRWQQVTVCFGLEIFPREWPFGPKV